MKQIGKILMFCLIMICYISFGNMKAEAGQFEQLACTGFLYLKEDQKWEEKYNTSYGEFKIRFRKLLWASDQKKYHLIIWWNGKRIADGYCPLNYEGYSFSVFHDRSTDRIFVSMETRAQINLFGYDPIDKKLNKYVDSKNYYSPDPGPILVIDKDSDLKLQFIGKSREYGTAYKLFWDESANWFGYQDVTKHPPVKQPVHAAPPKPVYHERIYETIYYEDEEVVGS